MLTALPLIQNKNRSSLKLNIFFLVLLELLILSNVAFGQELHIALPNQTVICGVTAGITLEAAAEHPNKELMVQWQIFQDNTWINITAGTVTTNYIQVNKKLVTTSKLILNTYAHGQNYRVAFGVNKADPLAPTVITATSLIVPAADFTLPTNGFTAPELIKITFSGSASANASYHWAFTPSATFANGSTAESKNIEVNWPTPGEKKVVLTVKDGNCVVTKEHFINIKSSYTWTGGVNTDWFNAANWSANAVPGAQDHAIVAMAPHLPQLSTQTSLGQLTVQSGNINLEAASLTVNGKAIFSGGIIVGSGEAIFNGDIEVNSSGNTTISSATLSSSTAQKIKNNGQGELIFTNLNLPKTQSPVSLETAITVNGLLDLKNGHALRLGNWNLSMGPAARIVADTEGYVVTNGTGTLQMTVSNTQTDVFFPVGNHSYNPVRISQTLAGTTDVFKVRVQGGLFDLYGPDNNGVEPPAEDGISRTWIIEEGLPGGSVAQVTLQFSPNNSGNDWAPSFDLNKAIFAQYADSWAVAKTGKPTLNGKNNMLELTQSHITSFRLFGVFNNDHQGWLTLPVELLTFTAKRINGQIAFHWATATEKNNDYFTLEQSFDSRIFNEVAPVKGAGNSIHQIKYNYLYKNAPVRLTYYRLKQTDFDGTVSYSKIIVVNALAGNIAVSAYPNPSTGLFKLTGVGYGTEANIIAANGQAVKKITALENDVIFNLNDQPAGIYILHLNSGNEVKTIRLIKK